MQDSKEDQNDLGKNLLDAKSDSDSDEEQKAISSPRTAINGQKLEKKDTKSDDEDKGSKDEEDEEKSKVPPSEFDTSCIKKTITADSIFLLTMMVVSTIRILKADRLGIFLTYSFILIPSNIVLVVAMVKGINKSDESQKRFDSAIQLRRLLNYIVILGGLLSVIVGSVIILLDPTDAKAPKDKLLRVLQQQTQSSVFGPVLFTTGTIYMFHGLIGYMIVCFLNRENVKLKEF